MEVESRRCKRTSLLRMRPLTNLGKYGYGIYVYHVPVVMFAKILFGKQPWFGEDVLRGLLFCSGVAGVSIAVAVLSYEGFEKRFLRLKRYFEPRYKSSLADRAGAAQPGRTAEAI